MAPVSWEYLLPGQKTPIPVGDWKGPVIAWTYSTATPHQQRVCT